MGIGIDFDGTIADTNAVKSRWIERVLGRCIPPYLCDRTSCVPIIGREAYDKMASEVYDEEHTRRLQPIEDSLRVIQQLAEGRDLVVVTARGPNRLEYARQWLSQFDATRGLAVESSGVSNETKASICSRLNLSALVDDDERHLVDAMETIRHAILMKQDAPVGYRSGELTVCRSWRQVAELLAGTL